VSGEPDTSTAQAASASLQDSLQSANAELAARVDERPELAVGAAFAGGFLLALILKRLAS
jgi:hypothetical protein